MRLQHSRLALVICSVLGGGFLCDAKAAPVNFVPGGTVGEFIDSNSIDLSLGHLIYAVNASRSGDNQTVMVGTTPVFFENVVDTPNVTQGSGSTFNGAIGQLYTTATDQAALDEVLNSHGFNDAAPVTLTLHNLTIGQNYRVQLIGPADTRSCCSARHHTIASVDGGTPGDISRLQDPSGDSVPHVLTAVGDFTADATSQALTLAGPNNAGYSALILTSDRPAIPEPTSLAMFAIAGFAVLASASRHR
jgi:hypothetical protein